MNIRNTIIICVITMSPVFAGVLYDNGPYNGSINAVNIFGPFAGSDSFTLATAATVDGLDFALWTAPGVSVSAIDWSITGQPGGGTVFGSGTGAAVSNSFLAATTGAFIDDYDINEAAVSGLDVLLGPGTYYLNLQNAVTSDGQAYWDVNNGPASSFYEYAGGSAVPLANYYAAGTDSTSFQVLGSPVPEPGTVMLLGSGLLAVAGALRRRSTRNSRS